MESRVAVALIGFQVILLSSFLVSAVQNNRTAELLAEYGRTKNWTALWKGLDKTLDKSSIAYRQLLNVPYTEVMPFWWVGYMGYDKLAEVLASGGQRANLVDNFGNTMLNGAAYGGHLLMVSMLLQHGAGIEVKAGRYNSPPIVMAAWGDRLETVKLLKQYGADLNAVEDGGATSLHAAAYVNNLYMVQYLVEAGAKTYLRDSRGVTPLDLARSKNAKEIVQYLSLFPH